MMDTWTDAVFASLMSGHLTRIIVVIAVSTGLSMILVRSGGKFQRGFALLTLGWSAVNAIIVIASLAGNKALPPLHQFREFLALNVGLNIAYIAVGITLMATGKEKPFQRGAGAAVLAQGLALLVLDAYLMLQLPLPQ